MIESMTGFGRATAGSGHLRWTVEIRSLNHRFFDLNLRLPEPLSAHEADIEKMLRPVLKRGRVSITVSCGSASRETGVPVPDEEKIGTLVRSLRKLARRYHIRDEWTIGDLLSLPGIFTAEKNEISERHWPSLKRAVEGAAQKLCFMRLREGRMIAGDFKKRFGKIKQSLDAIEHFSKTFAQEYQRSLRERVDKLSEGIQIDDERLAKEVVFQAERADVTEEIVRAKHHVESLGRLLDSKEESGKKIEFILQEIYREVNTTSSKCGDVRIANEVVRVKSELEKIREQVQNII